MLIHTRLIIILQVTPQSAHPWHVVSGFKLARADLVSGTLPIRLPSDSGHIYINSYVSHLKSLSNKFLSGLTSIVGYVKQRRQRWQLRLVHVSILTFCLITRLTRSKASWPSSSSLLAFSKDSKLEPIQRQTQNLRQILMLTLMLNMEVVPM